MITADWAFSLRDGLPREKHGMRKEAGAAIQTQAAHAADPMSHTPPQTHITMPFVEGRAHKSNGKPQAISLSRLRVFNGLACTAVYAPVNIIARSGDLIEYFY